MPLDRAAVSPFWPPLLVTDSPRRRVGHVTNMVTDSLDQVAGIVTMNCTYCPSA
jgi:hypothetical protein